MTRRLIRNSERTMKLSTAFVKGKSVFKFEKKKKKKKNPHSEKDVRMVLLVTSYVAVRKRKNCAVSTVSNNIISRLTFT